MTETAPELTAPHDTVPAPAHPLDPLTAEELRRAKEVLVRAGKVAGSTRFPLVQLHEPPKGEVLAFRSGDAVDRHALVLLLDSATGATHEAIVSVTRAELVSWAAVPTETRGQAPIMLEEFELIGDIVKADQRWVDAIGKRGITDLDRVVVAPLSAGWYDIPGESGRRLLRALAFAQDHPQDACWAHPIDGLVAYVDLIAREVVTLIDHAVMPVPAEPGNLDEQSIGPVRTTVKPLEISQPDGPGFTVDGHVVTWENWRFRIGFDPREGLTLHQIGYRDGDRERPLIYRASIAEMVVPYADPSPTRFWQNYFDAGEYNLGKQVNSLVLGCDCLGEIHYLDAVLADDNGDPMVVGNAICLHEEDHGVLWKHTDIVTGLAETRRSRRLVVSFFVTVGNYDYGFYWYFYQDGTIQLEAKLTGCLFTGAMPDGGYRWGTEVAPGLAAPYHQHLFNVRLDTTIDGVSNSVQEIDVVPVPIGRDNPYGNAFTTSAHTLTRESEAGRTADATRARTWRVVNPGVRNRLGQPVGYTVVPHSAPPLLADTTSSIARRATFATRHLWVTRYDPAERYPAGAFPNQHAGGAGLPEWTARDRTIDGEDIVLWLTFGATHLPRPEDWPVMPVDRAGFTLKPFGFFDRNPAIDLPRSTSTHCHPHGG
ncbi:MAG TPA: primary-amine oxidase [Actinophytocola sp.]|uniref:primary-amine oxidase n=1 Tax=Actinophytocola sp. TaxID=1872138 RepID=UPI002DDD1BCF|nr:primary-amine oxidase [Actinophytocola sp.]HEV2779550.1 primary-amine oxidase [Actinophytocola sp.]